MKMCDEYLDEDGPDAFQSRVRRAAKEHSCIACKETIRRGDLYRYSSGIFEGQPFSYRHCLRCWAMLDAIQDKNGESGDIYLDCGEIWKDPPPEVAALAFMTREEMQNEIQSTEDRT